MDFEIASKIRNQYKNEGYVRGFLNSKNVKYENICIKIGRRKIYPDFYLSDLNIIIEYNGSQHYQPVCFGNISNEQAIIKYNKQIYRDNLLRDYCNKNNIKLIEIDGRKYKSKKLYCYLENLYKMWV